MSPRQVSGAGGRALTMPGRLLADEILVVRFLRYPLAQLLFLAVIEEREAINDLVQNVERRGQHGRRGVKQRCGHTSLL